VFIGFHLHFSFRLFRHQRFEWERKDETDHGKRIVYYDASSGQAKILDQTDSGEKSSQKTKIEYNAEAKEVRVLGVGNNKGFEEEKKTATSDRDSNGENSRTRKFNDYQQSDYFSGPATSYATKDPKTQTTKESKSSSETYESKRTEVKSTNVDGKKDDYVKLQAAPAQRERLQPIETVPRATAMTSTMTSTVTSKNVTSSQGALKSYTNHGFSQAGENGDLMSNVQFQQPVAVIKAFVNSGSNTVRG
jgi:hypothetical protein